MLVGRAVLEANSQVLGDAFFSAFEAKGYTTLTSIQEAVLTPEASGRDLRITSQTGSGKTIAIGLAIRDVIATKAEAADDRVARPRALVVTPTRELGRQVEAELGWLYGPLGERVVSLTGGASYREELRGLARNPAIVVATPGRLLDHIERGSLLLSSLGVVALDEADRMLDMGFRDAIDAIFEHVPAEHRTHLVSATFPPDVRGLADRVQSNPLHLEGTRLGAAHADIEHVIYLVEPRQRVDALVNLLLVHADTRTLVFAKTRADVADLSEMLGEAGFRVAALSGEMAQNERNRALGAFKRGSLRVLVATDVAARGIDVSDILLVVHMEPPNDAESYTHRSGRTGRAGRKGTSALMVGPRELAKTRRVLERAKASYRFGTLPNAAKIRAEADAKLVAQLIAEDEATIDPRTIDLARQLVEAGSVERTLARLLQASKISFGPEPRDVRSLAAPTDDPKRRGAHGRDAGRSDRRPAPRPGIRDRAPRHADASEARAPRRSEERAPRERAPFEHGGRVQRRANPNPPARDRADSHDGDYAQFEISYGSRFGADPRRVLAMICRRGQIESRDVGAIRIGASTSVVEVRSSVADDFSRAATRPDPRDPRVRIRPLGPNGAGEGFHERPEPAERHPRIARADRPERPRKRPDAAERPRHGFAPPKRRKPPKKKRG
jgi:ATP-dependent RNA helicase DeaD